MPSWMDGYTNNGATPALWPLNGVDGHMSMVGTMHACNAGLDAAGEPCWCQAGDKVRIARLEARITLLEEAMSKR